MAARTTGAPISLIGLDPDMRTAIRGFEKVAIASAAKVRDFLPMLYTQKTFDPKTITYPIYSGIPNAVAWDGKSVIAPQGMAYLYDITATQYFYGNAVSYTFESQTFDLYGINNHKAEELGKSGAMKYQLLGADFFNNGFTTNWVDGVPFFSNSHPQDPRLGTTQDNLISGALAHDTLMDAIILGTTVKDPLGRSIDDVRPEEVWVYDTEVEKAKYIINESLNWESGSAENNQNPFRDKRLKVVGYPHFSTSTQWAVKFSNAKTFMSTKIPVKLQPVKQTDDWGIKQDLIFVTGFWAEDWRGWVGATGV